MIELKNDIFYVGIKDPTMRIFDIVMKTDYGSTYNAYIVKGEKTALIDCVHEKFSNQFIKNIVEILPISDIDYLICNHTEPDHSGCVKKLIELNPEITVVGTIAALKNLKEITNITFNEQLAKGGEELNLGKGKILKFFITPNLHWPDTMMTYLASEKTLFSCDVFGAHYCENAITDKEIIYHNKYEKAIREYYDCIISPFKGFAVNALKKISGLEIEMICTSHGPVIIKNIEDVIEKYTKWSQRTQNSKKTLAIFYVSAYGYTREMANIIAQVCEEKNINVKIFDINESNMSEMIQVMHSADALAFGSPTINRNALKPVWDIMSQLDMINQKGLPCIVFGSYGWSGEALHFLHSHLEMLRLKPFEKPFGSIFKPSEENKNQLRDYTERFLNTI